MRIFFGSILVALALLSSFVEVQVSADFGDFVDPTFNCPAMTTCPIVCVSEDANCPDVLACDAGTNLCLDGSCDGDCSEVNAAFDADASACPPCTPKACPRLDTFYDTCQEAFGDYYTATAKCSEAQEEAETKVFTLRESGFVAIYCWVCIVFVLMFSWCAFNQRVSPVQGSTQPLVAEANDQVKGKSKHNVGQEQHDCHWTQTGYTVRGMGLIGTLLYLLIMITVFGFQFLLGALTIFYYIQQESIAWFPKVFEDEIQVLKVHEITWGVGFFFTILLQWPVSIQSLFLRRSLLQHATHVMVVTPCTKGREGDEQNTIRMAKLKRAFGNVGKCFHSFMRTVFSDVSVPTGEYTRALCSVKIDGNSGMRYFYFRLRRYNFDEESGVFVPGSCSPRDTIGDFVGGKDGLTGAQAKNEEALVGQNIIYMRKPNFFATVIREFSKPFYIYQVFMIWTWFPLWYYYMACVQTIIVTSGGLVVSFFQFRNEKNLYRITTIEGKVSVLRNGQMTRLDQEEIVPGDVIAVEEGLVYADMIVIEANHLLVDESSLTGESTPMAKVQCDKNEVRDTYNYTSHKKHTISAGTRVIEVEGSALAVVLATGSHTAKGELLRDILSYQRHQFKFDTEVKVVIFILFLYSIFGFSLTVYLYKDDFVYEWFYGMFVVGTCLPPLLPTVFTVSVGISDNRLARKHIACVNNQDILVAGKVKMAFFDKTGTLTKQGLDFISASDGNEIQKSTGISTDGKLKIAMATCHSLTLASDGRLIGNAVDLNMFNSTLAKIQGSTFQLQDGSQTEVLKKFEFDHHRMTQSVIVKHDGRYYGFVKGSGESIKKICRASTVPVGFDNALAKSARDGIYQISFGVKELSMSSADDAKHITRDSLEYSVDFLGVVDFKNQLRNETAGVLKELEDGDVKSVMVTGDHALTGICIAKEAGLIKDGQTVIFGRSAENGLITWVDDGNQVITLPSINDIEERNIAIAVTGDVWHALLGNTSSADNETRAIAKYIRVFGRCTPNDKVSIVDFFVQNGITCCMVGDGGNDCGALKTAHNITSVVEVLKEGRCALASALASYKYMIIYGQVESINQIANAYFSVTFHEWCWVFLDGVWMMSMAFTLPLANAEKRLSPTRPTSSLLGAITMSSVIGVLALNFIFTCIALGALNAQDWYQCRKWSSTDISNITLIGDNYESSVLFIVTGYQYISSAMAFNWGFTFRGSWWKNYTFVALCLGYTIVHLVATLYPSKLSCVWRLNCTNENVVPAVTDTSIPINNAFNTTVMPVDFRVKLVVMMVFNTIAIMGWTFFVGNSKKSILIPEKRNRSLERKKEERKMYYEDYNGFSEDSA